MLITKISMISGKEHSREIDVTPQQLAVHQAGGLIQNVMPHLSVDDREFIISGSTPEEWDELYGEVDANQD